MRHTGVPAGLITDCRVYPRSRRRRWQPGYSSRVTDPEPAPADPAYRARPYLLGGAGVCVLEALALVVLGLAAIVDIHRDRIAEGLTSAVFFWIYALGLAACARGLWRARRWPRGAILLTQLIALGMAYSFWGTSQRWLAPVIAIPALAAVFCVLHPATTAALYGRRTPDDTSPDDV